MSRTSQCITTATKTCGGSRIFRSFSTLPLHAKTHYNQVFSTPADDHLRELNAQFQLSLIQHTFGYGSGVFPQAGYDARAANKPQIDLVHIVDDPKAFHVENSTKHPEHYSGLLHCGMSAISLVQKLGAGVYFNPYVRMADKQGNISMIKYGVVSAEVAFEDTTQWLTMYIAGRLQKPVKHFGSNEKLLQANQYNLASAFNLSLLLTPPKMRHKHFSQTSLYEKIALLSYMGDPRMLVGGENPNKVKNIVAKQEKKFEALYEPFLTHAVTEGRIARSGDCTFEKRMTPETVAAIISEFPLQFKRRLLRSYRKKYSKLLENEISARRFVDGETDLISVGSFLDSVARDKYLRPTLKATVLATIAYPALVQSLKGIFTAGVFKSAKYAWEKKMKSRAK